MLQKIFSLFKGHHHKKFYKSTHVLVDKINALEAAYQPLTDLQLQAKTAEFKARATQGEKLEDLLPEAFATIKNACRRLCGKPIEVCGHTFIWDMVPYDVQLIGGIALHSNYIAEMATGEGKTLVATLPLYLNALTGKNCQLATVNDYLARRDSQWMGYLYQFLGLSIGCIQQGMSPEDRKAAYNCDITYGASSEFGFDYLRDNGMALRKEDQVQRDHYFCMVDEADSILIDEARTPLIISGPANEESDAPFELLKPGIERLVHLQLNLCNKEANSAKERLPALEDAESKGDIPEEVLAALLKVKQGAPKNKQFLRILEESAYRKAFEKFSLEMQADYNRDKLYALKETLYFTIDEKNNQIDLTEKGRNALHPEDPDAFVIPDLPAIFSELEKAEGLDARAIQEKKHQAEDLFARKSETIHCLSQLLRAYCLYEKDVDYVVQEDKIVIIDENTGRAMPGRRWSEGLHQAVEAKESVKIEKESKTYATITIQNYFRLYKKLAGMTGTAETEAQEFYDIYKLEVIPIPTNKPCIRKDANDIIYKTRREKYHTVVTDIETVHKTGQPILVGTTSVENSEILSKMLRKAKVPHTVLNAKYHEREADIVALAGQRGAVTIATNMAGRGTDIKLGPGVKELGGLYVVGTERHESRRIDRQLRGRCARQGDPGSSKFYISLEDDLMRLFSNAGIISKLLDKTFEEGEALAHPMLNHSISSAQKKVEQQNFSIRKRLLQYDDVLNRQREVVYHLRSDALQTDKPRNLLFELLKEELEIRLESLLAGSSGKTPLSREALEHLLGWANSHFPIALKIENCETLAASACIDLIYERTLQAYAEKEAIEDPQALQSLERYTILRAIDQYWQAHLTEMEELRRSVGLRSYGQKDPLNEYKNEAYSYFEELMGSIRGDICIQLFRSASSLANFTQMVQRFKEKAAQKPGQKSDSKPSASVPENKSLLSMFSSFPSSEKRIGRNDLCPCGSGKKYKKCCG